jgi:glycosyltransferase involved in cell wall biosynthesis
MKTLAQELGIADCVVFHGFVSDERVHSLYDTADLFLMPAVQGYGIPAIESLHRGIPVLLHRESGVSDILLDTPWATVLQGGEESMLPALSSAITSVREGRHLHVPLPELPSEDSWAAEIARLCGWL